MSTRNERFTDRFLSLDRLLDNIDSSKSHFLNDYGRGVQQLIDTIDNIQPPTDLPQNRKTRYRKRKRAIALLDSLGYHYLVPTLIIFCDEMGHREKIIKKISNSSKISYSHAKRQYFRHRKLLLELLL